MNETASDIVREKAPIILEEINKANSILLHCHPSPDPDSVGSVLAMKFVLEQMGKKVTAIRGDSEIPQAFMHFPGAESIKSITFSEVDLNDYNLFIILDSASPEQVTRSKTIDFPLPIKSIVIDHHNTNKGFADVNLVDHTYPAVGQVLFDIFLEWKVDMSKEIAINLFMAIYSDTGGFKFEGTSARSFEIASQLAKIAPEFHRFVTKMAYSNTPGLIYLEGLAFSSIETFFDNKMALSCVSHEQILERNIPLPDVRAGEISSVLNTVSSWDIVGALFEVRPNRMRVSFRTHDANRYDVSKLAVSIGGGGHKAAAGAILTDMSLDEAKKLLVAKAKELYNL